MVRGSHGHWVGYVITPGLAIGVATSLWSIIRGAWGVFVEGHAERRARPKAPPATTATYCEQHGSSRENGTVAERYQHISILEQKDSGAPVP